MAEQTHNNDIQETEKDVLNDSWIETNDLLTKEIEKFFFGISDSTNSYKEWFEVVTARMTWMQGFNLYLSGKHVLVKVSCKDPGKECFLFTYVPYPVSAENCTVFSFGEEFKDEIKSAFILHPSILSKPLKMMKVYGGWSSVESIPKDYIDEDGFSVISCLL